jgi:uncharacterized cupredoxin-like copper-binding protein
LSILSLGLLACGGDDASSAASTETDVHEMSVMMRDIAFEPEVIEVKRGETVRLNFENGGALVHDFSVDSMPMGWMEMAGGMTDGGHGRHGSEVGIHLALRAGTHGMIEFERPTPASTSSTAMSPVTARRECMASCA